MNCGLEKLSPSFPPSRIAVWGNPSCVMLVVFVVCDAKVLGGAI